MLDSQLILEWEEFHGLLCSDLGGSRAQRPHRASPHTAHCALSQLQASHFNALYLKLLLKTTGTQKVNTTWGREPPVKSVWSVENRAWHRGLSVGSTSHPPPHPPWISNNCQFGYWKILQMIESSFERSDATGRSTSHSFFILLPAEHLIPISSQEDVTRAPRTPRSTGVRCRCQKVPAKKGRWEEKGRGQGGT